MDQGMDKGRLAINRGYKDFDILIRRAVQELHDIGCEPEEVAELLKSKARIICPNAVIFK